MSIKSCLALQKAKYIVLGKQVNRQAAALHGYIVLTMQI